MADTDGGAEGPAGQGEGEGAPRFSIAAQYVKDFSFENPNAPQSLAPPKDRPQIDFSVDVEGRRLESTNYEVTLRIGATASQAKTTLFVIELVYAGLFTFQDVPEENLEAFCLIECPRILFPFARRIIADATRDGGFPPMLIDPIDFAALYRQRSQQAETEGPEADPQPEAGR